MIFTKNTQYMYCPFYEMDVHIIMYFRQHLPSERISLS